MNLKGMKIIKALVKFFFRLVVTKQFLLTNVNITDKQTYHSDLLHRVAK